MRDIITDKPNTSLPRRVAIGAIAEVVLGGGFVVAATAKLVDSGDALELLGFLAPEWAPIRPLLFVVIVVEWGLGIALISGLARWVVVPAVVALLAVFSGSLALAGLRGFEGSCGCLGIGESVQFAAIRNVLLIAVAIVAMVLCPTEHIRSTQQGDQV